MPARRPRTRTPQEETIRQLESDLFMARRTIVDLMPADIQKVLNSFRGNDKHEVWLWAERAAGELVELCETAQQANYKGQHYGAPRAKCPLCRGGSSSYYEEGFALPAGLMRHLLGEHNARQCDVFAAAVELARWRADSPF